MTIPKIAIEKAISGGWHEGYRISHIGEFGDVLLVGKGVRSIALVIAEIALDPTFWFALGKALGWVAFTSYHHGKWNLEHKDLTLMSDTPFRLPYWQWQAHRFYALILTGENTDTFWEEIIGTNTTSND